MKYIQEIGLQIDKKCVDHLFVKQGDSGRYLLINIYNNDGTGFNLKEKSVRFYANKPDSTEVFNDCTIVNEEDGQAEVQLTNQTLACEGIVECEVVIKDTSGITISTMDFYLDVIKNKRNEESIESTNEFNSLTNALAQIDKYNQYYKETSGKIEEKYTTRLTEIDKKADVNTSKISSLENTSATKAEVEEDLKLKANNIDVYLKAAIDNLLSAKRDKNTPITLADVDQQFKQALTGGSVAAVGENAVDTVNVKNNAITNIKIANGAVGRLKQVGSIAQILTKDSIEINIKEGLLKIKNAPYCFTDTTSAKFGKDNTNFTIDKTAVLSKAYALYADMATLSIEFKEIGTITNPYMILSYIVFSGNINNIAVCYCGNSKSVKVFDNIGKEVLEREHSATEEAFVYPADSKQINIEKVADSTTDIKISINADTYLLATNYAKAFSTATEQTITLTNNKYLSKLYYNTLTSKFEAYAFSNRINVETYLLFVGWFILTDTDGSYWGLNRKSIYLNGTNNYASTINISELPFANKIYNALGDSLTYGLWGTGRLERPYPEVVKGLCGFSTANNYGISSSTVAANSKDTNWDSVRNPMVKRYGDMSNDADVISFMGGSNDYLANVPLGTIDSTDTDTFYGALNTLFEGLINKYPSKPIFVILPIKMRKDKEALRTVDNYTFREWTRFIKERAEYWGLPVLDLWSECGVVPDLDSQHNYINDGLHESQVYVDTRTAPKISKFINYRL